MYAVAAESSPVEGGGGTGADPRPPLRIAAAFPPPCQASIKTSY
jgi:hypothetical protein